MTCGRSTSLRLPGASFTPSSSSGIDSLNTRVITDSHPAYRTLHQHVRHDAINHELEYVNGDVHTQNIENYWSIFKRGVYGVFHHIGEDYIPCYLSEFDFRRNRRKVSDAQRFASLMKQTQGASDVVLQDCSAGESVCVGESSRTKALTASWKVRGYSDRFPSRSPLLTAPPLN